MTGGKPAEHPWEHPQRCDEFCASFTKRTDDAGKDYLWCSKAKTNIHYSWRMMSALNDCASHSSSGQQDAIRQEHALSYIPDIEHATVCRTCGHCCLNASDGDPCCDLVYRDGLYSCAIYKDRPEFCRKYPYPHLDRETHDNFCPLAVQLIKDISGHDRQVAESERKEMLEEIDTIKKDYEMYYTHWDEDEDPEGDPTFGDGAVSACNRISDSLRQQQGGAGGV